MLPTSTWASLAAALARLTPISIMLIGAKSHPTTTCCGCKLEGPIMLSYLPSDVTIGAWLVYNRIKPELLRFSANPKPPHSCGAVGPDNGFGSGRPGAF